MVMTHQVGFMTHLQIMNYSLYNNILNQFLQSVQIAFRSCPSDVSYMHFFSGEISFIFPSFPFFC